MRLRDHFAGLLAALAVTAAAAAQSPEVTLIPAEPVAPTRTQVMVMEANSYVVDGVPVPTGSAEASRRRLIDGSYIRSMRAVRCRFRQGVAAPLRCSCWASELTFFFGGCQSFFTPAWECSSCSPLGCGRFGPIQYGPGSRGTAPACDTPATGLPVSR